MLVGWGEAGGGGVMVKWMKGGKSEGVGRRGGIGDWMGVTESWVDCCRLGVTLSVQMSVVYYGLSNGEGGGFVCLQI